LLISYACVARAPRRRHHIVRTEAKHPEAAQLHCPAQPVAVAPLGPDNGQIVVVQGEKPSQRIVINVSRETSKLTPLRTR